MPASACAALAGRASVVRSLRLCAAVALTWLAAAPALAQAAKAPSHVGRDGLSPQVARLLDEIRAKDTGQLAVSAEDGRFLRLMVSATGATRVLEIGGASGYSAIWLGLGLRDTGGRLTTIEYDARRARELSEHIARAGLSDIVTVLAGDAFTRIPEIPGTFDLVFLDAWKRDYKRFLDLVAPRLEPGGVLLAHNVVNKRGELQDFLDAIEKAPTLWNAVVSPSGEGVSLTLRRRR
ncbi:MAG: O-methyltransferase [Vicinamibacterales bacterium]|nr:O-methyltransferase [Vicinamibacterales bacterium]